MVTMTVTGVHSMIAKLDRIKIHQMGKVEAALHAGGLVISNAAKQIITDKGLIDTGTMRRSVHPEVEIDGKGVRIGTNITDPNYPSMVEFGTSKMPSRPWLRPALDENKTEAINEIASVLRIIV